MTNAQYNKKVNAYNEIVSALGYDCYEVPADSGTKTWGDARGNLQDIIEMSQESGTALYDDLHDPDMDASYKRELRNGLARAKRFVEFLRNPDPAFGEFEPIIK